jgi:mono/diheme cytochrome c family protein
MRSTKLKMWTRLAVASAGFALLPALAEAPKAPAGKSGNPAAGKTVYMANCVTCHGPEGKGDGPGAAGLNPKPANFRDPARQKDMTEAKQVHIVTAGGPSEGLSPLMAPFGEVLTEQQIRDVVAFIRTTFK